MDDKTKELLQQLAQKLGTTVEYLWAVSVKGARVTGVADLAIVVICALLIVVAVKLGLWCRSEYVEVRAKRTNYSDGDGYVGAAVALVIGAGASLIVGIVFLYDAILALGSPEYYALTDLLSHIR